MKLNRYDAPEAAAGVPAAAAPALNRARTSAAIPAGKWEAHDDPLVARLFGYDDADEEAGIVVDAGAGTVVLWNAAAEQLFGYPAAEATGMPFERLAPVWYRRELHAALAAYDPRSRGRYLDALVPFHAAAVRRDGQEIAVEVRLASLEPARIGRDGGDFVLALARRTHAP